MSQAEFGAGSAQRASSLYEAQLLDVTSIVAPHQDFGSTSVRVVAPAPARSSEPLAGARPAIHGKFLVAGGHKLYVRGVTYGAFRPDADGNEYHDLDVIDRDFAQMVANGFNAVRIPHTMRSEEH